MKNLKFLAFLFACFYGSTAYTQDKASRPNILWLSFEDVSAANIACYGNSSLKTPNMDSLARDGIQYMNASSNAPQCSPARSTLITGKYATTYAMDLHPVPEATPKDIFFPKWISEAGYYATNNKKTHYNTTVNHDLAWDENNVNASYNSPKRKKDQPFFAVFNSETSHMGRVRTFTTDGRRDYLKEGIDTSKLILPSYLPNLPEIRSDYAGHLEAIQDVDKWIGSILKDLRKKNLADNTIIFVFSDHGGCLPRGKGYLYETGLQVPLIVYIPPALRNKNLVGDYPRKDHSLVSFVDFAPTVLGLANAKAPFKLPGTSIINSVSASKIKYQFGFAANQLHHFMPVRTVSNGKFKYMRSFIPYKQFALRNYYQWGMPANMAVDKLFLSGKYANSIFTQAHERHPAEMLFDLEKDPFETNNLANQAQYKSTLTELRNALHKNMRETIDAGFFTPTERASQLIYNAVRAESFPLQDYHKLVELAGLAQAKDQAFLLKQITSPHPVLRYWAAVGLASIAVDGKIKVIPKALSAALNDSNPYVAAEAAFAHVYLGKSKLGIQNLLKASAKTDLKAGLSLLECISLDPSAKSYIKPFTSQLVKLGNDGDLIDNEDPALMARGILVNIGEMNMADMHGEEAYSRGLELNKGRRKMGPSPVVK